MASRKEQSELQTPSLVSAVLVTINDAAITAETVLTSKTRTKINVERDLSSFMIYLLELHKLYNKTVILRKSISLILRAESIYAQLFLICTNQSMWDSSVTDKAAALKKAAGL